MSGLVVPEQVQKVLGGVALLVAQSPQHARVPFGMLWNRWQRPLYEKNFSYLEATHTESATCKPVFFLAWLRVSQAWVDRLQDPNEKLDYWGQEVENGPYLFLIDCIAPLQNPAALIRKIIYKEHEKNTLKGVVYVRSKNSKVRIYRHELSTSNDPAGDS